MENRKDKMEFCSSSNEKCFIFAAEIENYLLKMKRCNVTKRIVTKRCKNLTKATLPPKDWATAEKASETPFEKKICLDIKILLYSKIPFILKYLLKRRYVWI